MMKKQDVARRSRAARAKPRRPGIQDRDEWARRLSAFADESTEALVLFDKDLNLAGANAAGYKLLGIAAKGANAATGTNLRQFLPYGKKAQMYKAYRDVMSTGEPLTDEYTFPHPEKGDIHLRVNAFRAGEALGITVSDIAERKRMERELKDTLKSDRQLADLLPQIVFEIDDKGDFTYVNRGGLQTSGYGWADIERGFNALQIFVPEDRERVRQNIRRVLAGEALGGTEYTALRKDGGTFPVNVFSSAIVKDGRPVGLRGIAVDITERKQAERTLREREELFRALIENSLDSIAILNADLTVRYESPSAERTLGYKPEELADRSILDFLHPEEVEQILKIFETLAAAPDRSVAAVVRWLDKDGSWRVLEGVAKNLIHDPAVNGIVVNYRDITERRRSEEHLQHSEKRFRSVAETANDAIICADAEANIVFWNKKAEAIFGYTRDEILGRPLRTIIPPKHAQAFAEGLAKAASGVDSSVGGKTIEMVGLKKGGSQFPVELSHARWETGEGVFFAAIVRDITERKEGEQKLESLYQKERELRQKLEGEMNRRVEFTRALAHELKTPLTSVLASSDLLLDELHEEPLRSLARNISRSASNLDGRINELLDLARGEIGMLQLKIEPVDVSQLLRETADSMRPLAAKKEQALALELPPSLPPVRADEARLQQVVTNLLSNAIKFTPARGSIKLRARQMDTSLVVEVQDTGRGIPREEQTRLFEPYHRLGSDKEEATGLGLGLALSKTLIELQGGEIWVKSHVGRGSTFGFSIPSEGVAPQEAPEGGERSKLWTVLIIEDDPEIVDSVSIAFQLRWPEAELVSTGLGQEGVEMVETEAPDIVILDLGLPDISGFEVLRQIRLFSPVPVVILTVKAEEAEIVKGLEWGADDYIVKPFRQLELLARLKVQLRKQTPSDEQAPIMCGPMRLDPSTYQLTFGQREISLTIIEGRIVEYLMRNAGHVATHSRLAEAVWGEDYPGAIDSLRVYIRYLRQKIEDDPSNPKIILTKAGVGYLLVKPT